MLLCKFSLTYHINFRSSDKYLRINLKQIIPAFRGGHGVSDIPKYLKNMYPVHPKFPLKIMQKTKTEKHSILFTHKRSHFRIKILYIRSKIPLYKVYLKTLVDPELSHNYLIVTNFRGNLISRK